jgi:hypothetical protein
MDPLSTNAEYKGNNPSMPYITRLQDITNKFKLNMELAHHAWKNNIYYWHHLFPTWVPKTLNW